MSSGSVGYIRADGGALRPNTATLPPRGTSAGGGYSTVEDLLRFSNALLGRKLLNAEYTELVTTGDNVQNGVRWFGHGGGTPGMNGDLKIYPGSGYVIAALSNLDPPAAGRISNYIAERLPI